MLDILPWRPPQVAHPRQLFFSIKKRCWSSFILFYSNQFSSSSFRWPSLFFPLRGNVVFFPQGCLAGNWLQIFWPSLSFPFPGVPGEREFILSSGHPDNRSFCLKLPILNFKLNFQQYQPHTDPGSFRHVCWRELVTQNHISHVLGMGCGHRWCMLFSYILLRQLCHATQVAKLIIKLWILELHHQVTFQSKFVL